VLEDDDEEPSRHHSAASGLICVNDTRDGKRNITIACLLTAQTAGPQAANAIDDHVRQVIRPTERSRFAGHVNTAGIDSCPKSLRARASSAGATLPPDRHVQQRTTPTDFLSPVSSEGTT
jgi:hypothetical protein